MAALRCECDELGASLTLRNENNFNLIVESRRGAARRKRVASRAGEAARLA
jgi:hypothetical protein